jgi:hypothetical protein
MTTERPWELYWKLTPEKLRHDLLIHCLQQIAAGGCVDATIAAYAGFIVPQADHQYQARMADRKLADEWRAFHHKMAAIRVVAKAANLARGHESRVKKADKQLNLLTLAIPGH